MGLELIDSLSRSSTLALEGKPVPPEAIGIYPFLFSNTQLANAQEMLERSIMLMFRFMNNEDDDVSEAVFQFAIAYLNTVHPIFKFNLI